MFNLPTPYERAHGTPIAVDIDIEAGEDRFFLEACARTALEGAGADSESTCVALVRFVAASLVLKAHGGSATAILRDGHAICAGMSRAFCALCRVSGLPCREVSMYGLRGMGSHVMSEVYYDGLWHLFDPTFGLLFRSGGGCPCSLHDLICAPEAGEMHCTVPEPWAGFSQALRMYAPSPAPVDFMEAKYGFGLPERYREWFAKAYPVTYRRSATSFPVRIALVEDSCFECVAPDLALEGAGNRIGIDPETGWTSVGFAFCHTLFFSVPAGSFIELSYRFTGVIPEIQIMGLSAVRILDRRVERDSVAFLLHATSREPVAMVTAQTFGRVTTINASLKGMRHR